MEGIVVNSILQLSPLPLSPNPVPHRPSPLPPPSKNWLAGHKKEMRTIFKANHLDFSFIAPSCKAFKRKKIWLISQIYYSDN